MCTIGTGPAHSLVTIFTPHPACTNFPVSTIASSESRCLPTKYLEGYIGRTAGYYSPAICPSGYASICDRWDSKQGPTLEPSETAIQCGPTAYTCNGDLTYAFSGTARAAMIQVRWQSSDLSLLATHPLTPGKIPGALATDNPAATGTWAPGSTRTSSTANLTDHPCGETGSPAGAGEDGGKAAGDSTSGNGPLITPLAGGLIGAGSAMLLALLTLFVLRYRRHRPGKKTAETGHTNGFGGKSELPDDGATSGLLAMFGKDIADSPRATVIELPGTLAPRIPENELPGLPVPRKAAAGLAHTVVLEAYAPGLWPAEVHGEAKRC